MSTVIAVLIAHTDQIVGTTALTMTLKKQMIQKTEYTLSRNNRPVW